MIKISEIENLEFNISWAHRNREAIEAMGYTVEDYIAADKARLIELSK